MADRSRIRSRTARTKTSKTERPSRGKAKDAPEAEKPSAKINRAKAGLRVLARRNGRKKSPEAQAPDSMPLEARGFGAEATAAASGPEAQDAGANPPTGMPTEPASGDEPERMSAAQDQDAAPPAQPEAMDQAPPPYGVEEGADRPTANRSRRRRASPLEAGDAKDFKQRARAKRSDRREAASMAKGVPVAAARTEAADADADAQTTRRSRRAVGAPVQAAADTEPAPKGRRREPSTSHGERGKAAEKSQTAISAGASGPPWRAGIGVRTESGVAIGDLAGQAALAAARPVELERAVASAGLAGGRAVEPSIAIVTAELAEFAFRSMEEGMASLRELSRITTLPELAEFQARQAWAAVAAWQQHAARMNEIYGALLKPKDKSRK